MTLKLSLLDFLIYNVLTLNAHHSFFFFLIFTFSENTRNEGKHGLSTETAVLLTGL